jgi:hypothetical protein
MLSFILTPECLDVQARALNTPAMGITAFAAVALVPSQTTSEHPN